MIGASGPPSIEVQGPAYHPAVQILSQISSPSDSDGEEISLGFASLLGNATCQQSPIRRIKVLWKMETLLRSGGHAIALICRASRTPIATDRTPFALFSKQNRTPIAPDRTPDRTRFICRIAPVAKFENGKVAGCDRLS